MPPCKHCGQAEHKYLVRNPSLPDVEPPGRWCPTAAHKQYAPPDSRIVVALDGMTRQQMLHLAEALLGRVWGFKVNDGLFDHGAAALSWLKEYGNLFLDAKLHDIPNTVRHQAKRLVDAGADLITCHASGGGEMLRAAVEAAPGRVLAITVLTSMSTDDLNLVYGGYEELRRQDVVRNLLEVARSADIWGVVCSPQDLDVLPHGVRAVTPGYRPRGQLDPRDDQKAIGGAREAARAALVVVGRPITQAADPVQAADAINAELNEALRTGATT